MSGMWNADAVLSPQDRLELHLAQNRRRREMLLAAASKGPDTGGSDRQAAQQRPSTGQLSSHTPGILQGKSSSGSAFGMTSPLETRGDY